MQSQPCYSQHVTVHQVIKFWAHRFGVDSHGSHLIRHVIEVKDTSGMTRILLSIHHMNQIF